MFVDTCSLSFLGIFRVTWTIQDSEFQES